jgi:hypothetical protein
MMLTLEAIQKLSECKVPVTHYGEKHPPIIESKLNSQVGIPRLSRASLRLSLKLTEQCTTDKTSP